MVDRIIYKIKNYNNSGSDKIVDTSDKNTIYAIGLFLEHEIGIEIIEKYYKSS